MKTWIKRIGWIAALALLVIVIVRALRPAPVLVDTATIQRGTLVVSVDDDGRTRVRERYTIHAPISGRLLRTTLDPGDAVVAGETVLARFEPAPAPLLDPMSRAQAEARVHAAEASEGEVAALVAQAEVDADYAANEFERWHDLVTNDAGAVAMLDQARREHALALEALRGARFRAQIARFELDLARASLAIYPGPESLPFSDADPVEPSEPAGSAPLVLISPIDGTVLRVFEESARLMSAGEAVLEVGNLSALEVIADYLSQDAVLVRPGMRVDIEGWGAGEQSLHALVRRVEPGGFTKLSALGVEEQRVNILVDPLSDEETWGTFGDGYRVELRIVLWEAEDVLIVPTGALLRVDDRWCVFLVKDGRAEEQRVELGRRNGLEAEVLGGLTEDEMVVLYPSELVTVGAKLEIR